MQPLPGNRMVARFSGNDVPFVSHMGYSIEGLPLLLCEVEGTIERNLDRMRSAGPLAHTVTMLTSSYHCHFWEVGEGILLKECLGYLHSTFCFAKKREGPASLLSRATGRRTTTVSCSRPAASLRLSPRRITATKTCHMPINSF
ncbi:hypothetical protein Bca52824_052972 [Brassica carinata]|uniref:Uncharacterized protein n=1 Tax=Brassica carinata TaxID=52824 RepID=A0A8X7R506_BRACI|nr:hypothetical protein Bca52824_052972 [Brassica carinata]